jgi:hypothetical protein
MSARASSSRTAILAGTLAGLLAAGLGVYYWQLHPSTPAVHDEAQAPAPAPAKGPHSKAQASLALMALPELRAWSERIEKASGGKAHGALIEYDPAPRMVNGKRYWQLSFVENGVDAAHHWQTFLVSASDGEILVEDAASDELMSLERWRKEKHPMQRDSGG